jgi:hypothetical protein
MITQASIFPQEMHPHPNPSYFPNILFLFTSHIRFFSIQNSTSPYTFKDRKISPLSFVFVSPLSGPVTSH